MEIFASVNTAARQYFNAKEWRAWEKALLERAKELRPDQVRAFRDYLWEEISKAKSNYIRNRSVRRVAGVGNEVLRKASARAIINAAYNHAVNPISPSDAFNCKVIPSNWGHGKRMTNS